MSEKPLTRTSGYDAMLEDARQKQMTELNSSNGLKVLEVDFEAEKEQEVTLYTIPAAAKVAGIEVRTLHRAVKRGAIKSIQIEGSPIRVVTLEDVLNWKNHEKRNRNKSPK